MLPHFIHNLNTEVAPLSTISMQLAFRLLAKNTLPILFNIKYEKKANKKNFK